MTVRSAAGNNLGITQGRSGEFQLSIPVAGAPLGANDVEVGFANGTDTVVGGVELPREPSVSATFVSFTGPAASFGLLRLYQEVYRGTKVARPVSMPAHRGRRGAGRLQCLTVRGLALPCWRAHDCDGYGSPENRAWGEQ